MEPRKYDVLMDMMSQMEMDSDVMRHHSTGDMISSGCSKAKFIFVQDCTKSNSYNLLSCMAVKFNNNNRYMATNSK